MLLTAKAALLAIAMYLTVCPIVRAQPLVIVNPNFSAVAVRCSDGTAYQSFGPECEDSNHPLQDFDLARGFGWFLGAAETTGDGLTAANSTFQPPPFTGLPFTQAAYLQGATGLVSQRIAGFVPGGSYTLSFYLGSRYRSDSADGNQTIQVGLDGTVLGTYTVTSYSPFALKTVSFTTDAGGPHDLRFTGLTSGDHTAFFSDVSIETAGSLSANPSSGFPGLGFSVSTGGFTDFEQVTLFGYGSSGAPVAIGAALADAEGNVAIEGRIPQTVFGTLGLRAVGADSGAVAVGTIAVNPILITSPKAGNVGQLISAGAFGFLAGEEVSVTWLNPSTLVASSKTRLDGTLAGVMFAIPTAAPIGPNTVIARGRRSGATASAQIIVQ